MRDCKTCIHSEIGHGEGNGCTAWNCEYINKWEALEVYKHYKDTVQCKDCKWYNPAELCERFDCVNVTDDDYCSYGEREE